MKLQIFFSNRQKTILKVVLIFCVLLAILAPANAQDVYFSQFFMNPTYLNPAYTGTMKVPRVSLQYRNQWPAMGNAYINYFAAFDTYLPSIGSGVGLLVFNDVQGSGLYSETSFKALFSKEIILSREWTMYGSITAGAKLNSLNFSKLTFADQIDLAYGNYLASSETSPESNTRLIPDFGAGLLFFNDKYFVGIAGDHLSEPDQSISSANSYPLKRKFTAHFEYSFPWFRPGHLRKLVKFTPNFVLQSQGDYQWLAYGFYANRKGISLGIWNRLTSEKNTDLVFMASFIGKQLKTAISYDVNINGVGMKSHGSVELTVSFLLKAPGKKSIFPFYEIPGEWDIH
jgi:type IX secretion system PorP/SprF family membrane protein